MIFIWHNFFFIWHDKNEGEEGHEKGEVDMIQMLDIVQKLSIDPTFLSLLHDLMHKTADRFHGLRDQKLWRTDILKPFYVLSIYISSESPLKMAQGGDHQLC